MSTELLTLLALAGLSLLLPFIYGTVYSAQVGVKQLTGNRDGIAEPEGAAGRGLRAHRNLTENLVPYAAVVLTAQAVGVSNTVTATAAIVFLVARVLHAAFYLLGIPVVRTAAYYTGVFATVVIAAQILLR